MNFKIILAFLILMSTTPATAQGSDPTPPPMIERLEPGNMDASVDRLAPPPMPDNPSQADYGAQVYYQICMVCHGDRGQGLTDEWRGVLDLEDQDCWQSRCHATNHPPDGFIFPKYVPPVVGAVMPARFKTALELYDYLSTRMPWQAAGTRSEEEYWQLTAFLLRLNSVDPGDAPLDRERAAAILLAAPTAQASPLQPVEEAQPRSPFWLVGGLALGAVLLLVGGIIIGLRLNKPEGE